MQIHLIEILLSTSKTIFLNFEFGDLGGSKQLQYAYISQLCAEQKKDVDPSQHHNNKNFYSHFSAGDYICKQALFACLIRTHDVLSGVFAALDLAAEGSLLSLQQIGSILVNLELDNNAVGWVDWNIDWST